MHERADERTEGLQEHQQMQGRVEGANRFEGTMKFNRQQLNSIRDNTNINKYPVTHQSLRESHDSVRSIQK